MAALLGALHKGPELGAAAATSALLITACDLHVRFEQYRRYPFALCRLCKRYNPDEALLACMNFLGVEATELDVGLSLPLQRRAQRYETETEQIAFLARDDVQEMLVTFLVGAAASTLEVEPPRASERVGGGPSLPRRHSIKGLHPAALQG